MEACRSHPWALLGDIVLRLIEKKPGSTGAKLGVHELVHSQVWIYVKIFFYCYLFSFYCLLHLLPCRIATKWAHLKHESPLLLILQRKQTTFENPNMMNQANFWPDIRGIISLELVRLNALAFNVNLACFETEASFPLLWEINNFSPLVRRSTCTVVYFGELGEYMANADSSKCVHISLQRIYELFVPDTLHSMLSGFKKTLFHVLTLISLVCQLTEQRGSLLYAAVICSISVLFLTSISLWYLVKVIFS